MFFVLCLNFLFLVVLSVRFFRRVKLNFLDWWVVIFLWMGWGVLVVWIYLCVCVWCVYLLLFDLMLMGDVNIFELWVLVLGWWWWSFVWVLLCVKWCVWWNEIVCVRCVWFCWVVMCGLMCVCMWWKIDFLWGGFEEDSLFGARRRERVWGFNFD